MNAPDRYRVYTYVKLTELQRKIGFLSRVREAYLFWCVNREGGGTKDFVGSIGRKRLLKNFGKGLRKKTIS